MNSFSVKDVNFYFCGYFFKGWGVITKALISYVADNTNQAAGLIFIFSGRSIGFVAGSSMAGYIFFSLVFLKYL